MDERAIGELRALAARDRELEEGASRLRSLDAAIAEIRDRAEVVAAFFAERAQRDDHLRKYEASEVVALERRRSELDEARTELERARSSEERVRAAKRLARATDHVDLAERGLAEARGERRSFDESAEQLARELLELEERARAMGAPNRDIVEWASSKHAELFVALGQLDTQRERVIREANELATALLGEPTFGSTLPRLLDRLDAARSSQK
jgi:chromosome segregation ATPase